MATLYCGYYYGVTPYTRIFRSVDTGVTWTSTWTSTVVMFPHGMVSYPNDSILVFVSSGNSYEGLVYRSVNGGITFDQLYNVASAGIDDVQKSRETEDVIFACGRIGQFWKSTNKGLTFTYNQIAGYTTTWWRSVSFLDDNTGFICGGQYILKTIDGGVTWTQKYSVAGKVLVSIFAVDANTIWALPEAAGGHVLKSTDGGTTWSIITTTKSGTGKRIAGLVGDANHLWFVSSTAAVVMEVTYTSNGGTNWASTNVAADNVAYDRRAPLFFVNANTGFCLSNYCYKSTDGGQTWSNIGYMGTFYALFGMVEMDFAVEFRSFNVAGAEPTNRTTEGTIISAVNPLNFGSVGAGNNSVVKVLVFRAKSFGTYTTITNMRFYLYAKDLVGTNNYYCDITNTWTQNKTVGQVSGGTPGTIPQTEPAANITKIGGGNITGVEHANTSQYIYLAMYIGNNEPGGAKTLTYRMVFDYS